MKFIYFILFGGLTVSLLSCDQQSQGENTNQEQASKDTLVYAYNELLRSSGEPVKNEDSEDTTFFRASFPEFQDSAANTFIQQQIVLNDNPDVQYSNITEQGDAFIADYEAFLKDTDYARTWEYDLKCKVIRNTPVYLATTVEFYSFSGGAHGNHATLYHNYDPVNKKALTLTDVVSDENYDELNQLAESIFRKQEGLTPEQTLDDYFFEDNTFKLNENFTLTKDGLLFLYNIYEIKPYADGTTELIIPAEEVRPLLTEKAKELI